MGYRVKAFPTNGHAGYLSYGNIGPAYNQGTYYPHPSNAIRAAQTWVNRHPGGRAQIEIYRTGEVVDEVTRPTANGRV